MLQLDIATIALDPRTDQPVLFMKPHHDPGHAGRVLPIALGHPEATAILVAVQGVALPRPMTHDLLASVVGSLNAHLMHVTINGFDRGTFHATLTLSSGEETHAIDARPSDAIALAVRLHAPVFVTDEVFNQASVPEASINLEDSVHGGPHGMVDGGALMGRSHVAPREMTEAQRSRAEEARAEFHRFIEGVKPEDF